MTVNQVLYLSQSAELFLRRLFHQHAREHDAYPSRVMTEEAQTEVTLRDEALIDIMGEELYVLEGGRIYFCVAVPLALCPSSLEVWFVLLCCSQRSFRSEAQEVRGQT